MQSSCGLAAGRGLKSFGAGPYVQAPSGLTACLRLKVRHCPGVVFCSVYFHLRAHLPVDMGAPSAIPGPRMCASSVVLNEPKSSRGLEDVVALLRGVHVCLSVLSFDSGDSTSCRH